MGVAQEHGAGTVHCQQRFLSFWLSSDSVCNRERERREAFGKECESNQKERAGATQTALAHLAQDYICS